MPRVCDSDSNPIDYCRDCFPSETEAESIYKFTVSAKANDGRGCCFAFDPEHPSYDDEDYQCKKCGCDLTSKDD